MKRIALDVHAHLVPADQDELRNIHGVTWQGDDELLIIDGHRVAFKSLFRPEAFIDWMDHNGVETAWISIPPLAYRQHLQEEQAATWTRYINEGLARLAARFPTRLAPLFHLPVEHPNLAEVTAAATISAEKALFAMATGAGPNVVLSDEAYEPLWRVLNDSKAFVFLHPPESCDGRLKSFYLHNLLGNPSETAIAALHLALSGVLDRHPHIRICLAHGGGTTAGIVGRVSRGQETGRPDLNANLDLAKTFRRFCVDCITHDFAVLQLAGSVHGADNILFGSDWPFPMGITHVDEYFAGCDGTILKAIFQDNPQRLVRSGG